jgi:hypothetical protein
MNEEMRIKVEVVIAMLRDQGLQAAAQIIDDAMRNIEVCEDQSGAIEWCGDAARLLYKLDDIPISFPPGGDEQDAWDAFCEEKDELLNREW